MKIKDLVFFLDERFKPEYKESYDNVGFLMGDPQGEVNGVLATTDVTPMVVEESIDKGANFIISHHPLIFSGLKRITPATGTGRMVMRLIQNGIGVYAAHTNLDNMKDGVNGILAEKLGLADCRILRTENGECSRREHLSVTPHGSVVIGTEIGAGMVGVLSSPMALGVFFDMVKERLHLPVIRCSRDNGNRYVRRVAICGGSGSFLIDDAKTAGADIYLTGDLKYHDFQTADDQIILADIGHFESEQFAKEIFYRAISEKFSNFACFISKQDKGYIEYI